jgi:hypothetical protein
VSLAIVQVSEVPNVSYVERYVAAVLSDENYVAAQGLGNTRFIEHVCIPASQITDHYPARLIKLARLE